MKKFFVVLTVLAVICLGILGGLAALPHAHDNDLDHSQHKDCPVYQFGLGNVHADIAVINAVIVLFLFLFCTTFQTSLPVVVSGKSTLLRSPPILS